LRSELEKVHDFDRLITLATGYAARSDANDPYGLVPQFLDVVATLSAAREGPHT